MRNKLNIIKKANKFKPYDYSFMLELELESLKQMTEYFSKSDITECDKKIAAECKLAYNLLNIFLGNHGIVKREYYTPYGDIPLIKNSQLLKYINTKNAKRFCKYFTLMNGNNIWNHSMIEELYEQKAWYLYNKLRTERLQEWYN